MSSATSVQDARGQCLCQAVQISVKAMKQTVGACHCNMCRTWSGGPLMVVDCGSDVEFSGQEFIAVFESSDWAERGFCRQCGTHLFYRLKHNQQHFIPAGLFTDCESFVFDHQVFIDEKPAYYCFANDTHNLTGEELVEQFTQSF